MFKLILLTAALKLFATTALAADTSQDLRPLQGTRAEFNNGASVLVYYTAERDGFHVVATVASDDTPAQKVFRFTTVLADGQSTSISVRHDAGEPDDSVTLAHAGDRLHLILPRAVTLNN
jgi:hypothetical protein